MWNAILLTEVLFFIYTDWLLYDASGHIVEWPTKLMMLRALGSLAAQRVGPFSTPLNRLGWLGRLAFSGASLAAFPRLRPILWRNVGYRITLICLLLEAALENANQRRLRRKYAAHVAATAAAAEAQMHQKTE